MKCPECQFENPDSAKFCIECGNKIEVPCPSCTTLTPAGSKFCLECGQDLRKPEGAPQDFSFDDKLARIQKYLPKGLTEKILSQRDKIEGERKQVTVMFCDIEGFTPLVERLGAEEAYSIMDQVYEVLIHKVHDYEGTVNEMTGDGIVALFGAPIALEDAPQRAIRSSLSIHREMSRYNDKMKEEGRSLPPLKMRIGIHTGPVVVGTMGNDLRVEFKAVGDTVNLASRMEGLAEPGATYISEATFKLTEGLFRVEALGEKAIKGKKQPVEVFRVIAPSSRRTRFDVSAERGLTPFVGRERELELLLDSLERVKEDAGQAFSIIGEAGIGKSRFLYEFRKAVSNEDITFLEGKCLSYGTGVSYHPISDVLKGNFEIGEDDDDEQVQRKVKKGLEALQADERSVLPCILELLGVKESGIDRLPLSPEGRKDRILEAVRQIILKGAQIRPLVIAIEDLHWADKSTEETLKFLLEDVPGARVLIIFTYRPEFVHTWEGRSYHNHITLNRLSNRESLLMVSSLLVQDTIDPELQRLILSKTEGVPFFVEEFVKSLQSLEVIKRRGGEIFLQEDHQSLAIPSTIQDMIMARVDRLSDGAKDVLLTGSVIEREFSHDLIRAVTDLPEPELITCLSTLKDAELLYERGVYPQNSYIFRHALTRDVAYASILERRRRDIHRRIGTVLEEVHQDDLVEQYEKLSEHFYQGADYTKAAEYARRSAAKAEKSASILDAITHAQKRVVYLDRLPETGRKDRELIDARTSLGLYHNQINHWTEARDAVEPVARLARDKGYWKRYGQIQMIMGCYYGFIEEDFPNAFQALDEALGIAVEENDYVTLALVGLWSGIFQAFDTDFEKAINTFQRGVDINTAANTLWGIASIKANQAYFCYFWTGKINSFVELASEALKIAQESGDPFSRGISHTAYGFACFAKGNLEDAERHALEGKNLCERIRMHGWAGNAWMCLARVYFRVKEYSKSKMCYEQILQTYQPFQILPTLMRYAQLGMARCEAILGERDVALETLRPVSKEIRLKIFEGLNYRYMGEILLNLGDDHIKEAEQWIQEAIEADKKNGTIFNLGQDYVLYAEFVRRNGDLTRAREKLGQAIDIYKQCGADGWVEKAEKELAAIS